MAFPVPMANHSIIRDIALAPEGDRKIDWVAQHAHVLNALKKKYLDDGSLRGRRIAICVHLEAKTAYLALLLREVGAEVIVSGSNPLSTQDEVAAALVRRGLRVHATHGAGAEEFEREILATLDAEPELLIDDGAELVSRLYSRRQKLVPRVRAASEETTTGVIRLRAMEREGVLTIPVIAANDAMSKHLFDNRYGTGQSTLTAIMSATNLFLAGKNMVVCGYGWCGRGLARYAAGFGANVIVVETDPVKALEAVADGYAVMSLEQAAPVGDCFITATGSIKVLREEHFRKMKDGALLANAGNYAHEIDRDALARLARERREARAQIEEFVLADGRRIHLIAEGALVNIAASDGHPVEIMDLSFSVQALSIHHLANHAQEMKPGVHRLPAHIDEEIARTKLALLGATLERVTSEQHAYLKSWQ